MTKLRKHRQKLKTQLDAIEKQVDVADNLGRTADRIKELELDFSVALRQVMRARPTEDRARQ